MIARHEMIDWKHKWNSLTFKCTNSFMSTKVHQNCFEQTFIKYIFFAALWSHSSNGIIHTLYIHDSCMKLNILDSVCLLYCVNVKTLQSNHRLNTTLKCMQFSQPAKEKQTQWYKCKGMKLKIIYIYFHT